MNIYIFLVLTLSVIYVSSIGVFLDRVKGTVDKVKCGAHNVGKVIFKHGHHEDPCQQNQDDVPPIPDVDYKVNSAVEYQAPKATTERLSSTTSEIITTLSSIQTVNQNTTEANNATGRRVLSNVKPNCASGDVADKSGTCREGGY